MVELPLLSKPTMGEVLYLYIVVSESSLSLVLVKEEGVQKTFHFVRRVLQGPENRYREIEKAVLVVMVTTRKLRPHFLSHRVKIRMNLPFQQTLDD